MMVILAQNILDIAQKMLYALQHVIIIEVYVNVTT